MLDMSRSMLNNGCFLPAKKVALALDSLIRGQFPRDACTSSASRCTRGVHAERAADSLMERVELGTNMQPGSSWRASSSARHKGGNRQIIIITDGEPTAHLENGEADFSYPPTPRARSRRR